MVVAITADRGIAPGSAVYEGRSFQSLVGKDENCVSSDADKKCLEIAHGEGSSPGLKYGAIVRRVKRKPGDNANVRQMSDQRQPQRNTDQG